MASGQRNSWNSVHRVNVNSGKFKVIRYVATVGTAAFTAMYTASLVGAWQSSGVLRGITDWVFHWQLLLGAVFVGFLAVGLWTNQQLLKHRQAGLVPKSGVRGGGRSRSGRGR